MRVYGKGSIELVHSSIKKRRMHQQEKGLRNRKGGHEQYCKDLFVSIGYIFSKWRRTRNVQLQEELMFQAKKVSSCMLQ